MINNGENLKNKQIEISLYTLDLIDENIRLYQDNIKLNHEVRRIRKQLRELEDVEMEEDSNSVVILVMKKCRELIN